MSSPIVDHKKSFLKNTLIHAHQKYSHNQRVRILAQIITEILIKELNKQNGISILDIGCGDMQLSERIQQEQSSSTLTCIDIHSLPDDLRNIPRWQKYRQFDGRHIPFTDKQFDAAIFCDVLHHDQTGTKELLLEGARVARYIIIKDHFESSLLSRWILKALDFIGNWGYGVTVPKAYFRKNDFFNLCREVNLEVKHLEHGIDLYSHIPFANRLISPNLQFIAILEPTQQTH